MQTHSDDIVLQYNLTAVVDQPKILNSQNVNTTCSQLLMQLKFINLYIFPVPLTVTLSLCVLIQSIKMFRVLSFTGLVLLSSS